MAVLNPLADLARLARMVRRSLHRDSERHRLLPRARTLPGRRGGAGSKSTRSRSASAPSFAPASIRAARDGGSAALPLGGYVKFHGDANVASVDGGAAGNPSVDRSLTLAGQPLRNRAAIVAAGPVANFLLAFVIFTGMFMAFGRVEHVARIGRVEANSPAAAAGFQPGDSVKSIDGEPIDSFEGLQESTLMSTGLPMSFVVERGGQ